MISEITTKKVKHDNKETIMDLPFVLLSDDIFLSMIFKLQLHVKCIVLKD